MNQLPSSSYACSSGGVNRTTAVAVLVAVMLFSVLVFVTIAETVFPSSALAREPMGRHELPMAPSVVRPDEGAEVATVEPAETGEPERIEASETDPSESENVDENLSPRPRHGHRHEDSRPTTDPHPARTESAPATPANPANPGRSSDDLFGRDTDDPLGNLDFGSSVAG